MRTKMLLAVAAMALVATACPADDQPALEGSPPTPEPAPPVAVQVATTELGDILVDGEGRTLYVFLRDEPNVSDCTGQCLDIWPPLLADAAEAGAGADAALLGTTTERQGPDAQVTYNQRPLYYYSGDTEPGEMDGQGVGENWYVVSPAGEPIQ